ncbi:unnamed protein product, partial [Citrullus colocynthis]
MTKLNAGQLFNSPHSSVGHLACYSGHLAYLVDAGEHYDNKKTAPWTQPRLVWTQ